MVTDHQPQRQRLRPTSRNHRVGPDEAVFQASDLDNGRVVHHDRVLDLRLPHRAIIADRGEWADETVCDRRSRSDRGRSPNRRVDDLGPSSNDNSAIDLRLAVDGAFDVRFDFLEQQPIRFKQWCELPGIDPPAGQQLASDLISLIDEPLDCIGDLQLTTVGWLDSGYGIVNG